MAALIAFEAASRLQSFTRAAAELNVTQAAVSHQIAALEARLGTPLFRRLHRRIELTTAGDTLSRSLSSAFGQIVEAVRSVSPRDAAPQLVIATTTAFSHFWLMPRLANFRAAFPGRLIRISAQDSLSSFGDIDADVVIRYGMGTAKGVPGFPLFADCVVPVASPHYLERFGIPETVGDLAEHALIDHDRADASWLDWNDYLGKLDQAELTSAISVRCSSYLDIVYAALDHQGIALGWRSLVDPMIERGQLMVLPLPTLPTPGTYRLIPSKTPRSERTLAQFVDWIRAQSQV